jgi:hypothetical protein
VFSRFVPTKFTFKQNKLATVINMGRGLNKKSFFFLGVLCILSITATLVMAAADYPFGARGVTYIDSSRANSGSYPPANITSAQAGNVTEITLNTITSTRAWQGYYGNITGTITLEDASGNVFYNWTALEPKGQIYASINSSVTWSSIRCFNWTDPTQTIDVQSAEDYFGIKDDAADGLNDTYTENGLDTNFYVGVRNITAESDAAGVTCHTTNTYIAGAKSQDDFENVLLTDGNVLVFTTIIENNLVDTEADINGFDGRPHDFQMLVAEDGHDAHETQTMTYFFWAEIR